VSSASAHRPLLTDKLRPKAKSLLLLTALTLAFAAAIRTTPTVEALDSEEQAFLQLLNTYRQQNGLQPINLSPTLTPAAELHSEDMADNNYFSHTSLDGRTFVDRVRDAGYTYDTWLGENIAAGYVTAQEVFNGWKNSPTHNTNMLRPQFNVIGIGRAYNVSSDYEWYWTTDFGGYDDSIGGDATTTILAATTTTVLATQTTIATTTATTTSISTLTQTSIRTVTTAASTSTVSVTTLTTTIGLTETASSTTYVTRVTTMTTTAYVVSTEKTTISTTENQTYTFLITHSSVSTVATTTSSTTTEFHVTTLTTGMTTEKSTSTVEEKVTATEIVMKTSTRTITTFSLSTQNHTVTLTEPLTIVGTITVRERAPTTVETTTTTITPSNIPWHQNPPPLLVTVSLVAAVAVFATFVIWKH